MNEGGNSLDESIGLITAANEVVNDPSSVGTALKTLTLRLRGAKTELEEMGEDVSDMATTTSSLQAKLLALTGGQVDIMLDENTFKNSTEILREMAAAWEDMNDIQRASALELMGGKRQANVLSALIQNFDTVEAAIEASANSAGSALKENERYLSSIQGRIDQFNNAVQTMWNDFIDDDVVKFVVDLGTKLVNLADTIGMIPTILLAIGAVKGLGSLFKGFDIATFINNISLLTMGTEVLDAETRKVAMSLLQEQINTKLASSALVQYAISQKLATAADVGKMTTTQLLGLSFKALGVAIWGAVKAITAFLFTNPVGWLILAIGAIAGGIAIFNHFYKTTEELTEELSNLKSELQDIQSEIDSLNSELETTQDRMAELLALDTLSFTEEEELKRLKKQNDELQREIDLQNTLAESKKKETEKTFKETMESKMDQKYMKDNWDGLAGTFTKKASGWNRFWGADTVSGEEALQSNIDVFQEKLDYNQQLQEKAIEAQKLLDSGEGSWIDRWAAKIEISAFEDNSDSLGKLETSIAAKLEEYKTDIEGIEYGDDPEVNAYLDYVNNMLDRWAITLGGDNAETNALTRIFNKDEFDALSNELDGLQKKLRANPEDTNVISQIEEKIENSDIKDDLDAVGLDIEDAINYWTMLASGADLEVEVEVDYEGFNNAIDAIQDAYSTLTDVVSQYNETGYLTLDSLQSLLSLEPEYLALLQMENGQLSLNQDAMQTMVQAKLAEAKATVVASAIKQLDALAAKTQADEINNSSVAASNSIGGLSAYASILGTVGQEAIVAAGQVAAFNAAVEGAQANEIVNQSEIDSIISNMNTQLQMIDSVGANLSTNFGSIVDPGSSSSDSAESAAEALQKKYERQIKNLENQQTYLQNEIDLLEAEDKTVAKAYYEEQIALEEEKIALYEQEREALKQLEMTDEVADALWEVEHAIQESALALVEFRQSIIDLYKTAFDETQEAFDNLDDLYSDQQNYIDKYMQLMELQGGVKTRGSFIEAMDIERQKMQANEQELKNLVALRDAALADGNMKVGDDEWVQMEDEIRAAEEAILDNKIALEEYNEELKQLSVEAFELVRNAFGYKDEFFSNQQSYIEGYADLLDAMGVDVPDEVYQKLIEIEKEKRANYVADLTSARQDFAKIEAAGFTAADEEWQDAYTQITDLEKKIQDSDIAMAQWNQTIREAEFEKFDRFIGRLDDMSDELQHLYNIISKEDVATEDGEWTEEGITSLGILYHQMELAEQKAEEYRKKIEELNDTYAKGEMSEQEYYEQLQELKDGQWDAIETTEDLRDAVVDLEEARIDMIEEGINKEIESYSELIKLKKEELDAERDLYNFKKNVEKQSKDLAELDRRIASLSGSTSASDIAELRKLQAERREAQSGLDDTYYEHSMDARSQALDGENQSFEETKNRFVETLRETLEDTETLINEKITEVLMNADNVLGTIDATAAEQGVTLTDSLRMPWIQASEKATDFKNNVAAELGLLANDDGIITLFGIDVSNKFTDMFGIGSTAANNFGTDVGAVVGLVKKVVSESTSPLTANLKLPWDNTTAVDGPINTFSKTAQNAINGAVNLAKTKATQMTTDLSSPWSAGTNAVNTFSSSVSNALEQAALDTKNKVAEINAYIDSIKDYPDDTGSGTGGGGLKTNGRELGLSSSQPKNYRTNATLTIGSKTLTASGIGTTEFLAIKSAETNMSGVYYNYQRALGTSEDTIYKLWTKQKAKVKYNTAGAAAYAKGTLATKRDELALTDEPTYGDELILVPNEAGNLSFLRKGTGVVPADMTKRLFELAQMPTSDLMNKNLTAIVPDITKNDFKNEFNFESLVHVDTVDSDTLPKLEKMVDKKIDDFSKALNYSLKKFAR